MFIDFSQAEVARYYAARLPELKQRGKEWRGPCPVHHGKDDNFSVNAETGQAHCHSACGKGWDIIALEQELTGAAFPEAKTEAFALAGKAEVVPERKKRGEFECAYDYTDEAGKLVYQVVRFRDPKTFSQRRPDGHGGWSWGLSSVNRLPYRLPALKDAPFVFIAEGEKDADALSGLGLVATCNSGGAGNFAPELALWFTGKDVAILPDNDDPGRSHALKVAKLLYGTAKSIKVVELPDLPEKGDVSDYLAEGGTVDGLRSLYREANFYTPELAPHPEDQYTRNLGEEIAVCGGVDKFWDMSLHGGVPTPFDQLTRALGGGLLPGEVYAIAARTGHGKTSLGLQFAIKAARTGMGVLIYSMEMTWRAVFQRMVSIEARVDLNDFRIAQDAYNARIRAAEKAKKEGVKLADADKETKEKIEKYNAALPALNRYTCEASKFPVWVSTKSRISPRYLVEESERQKARLPKLDLIIVDHMQLMGADEKTGSEYEKFTAISRALKQSAKALNLPVLVMAQIKRLEDKHQELEISDIRGSGAIEEDMAGVMLIYEDNEDAKRAKVEGVYDKGPVKTWLKLDKNRFGSSGMYMPLMHFKRYTRFDSAIGDTDVN